MATVAAIVIMAQNQNETSAVPSPINKQPASQLIAKAIFNCDNGKTINTAFYSGKTIPSADPNLPPTPGGSVNLILSDGRSMTLPHVISADGGRYANTDESFIFWNRGDTAFITENNVETYTNCFIYSNK